MQEHDAGDLYPLKLSVAAKEKVWGGHKIARILSQDIPADRPIGEAWVVWDQLAVADGPIQGTLLAELVRDRRQALLGSRVAAGRAPGFPLLVKILDARETLSVQVHPDDRYAQGWEGEPYGKAEMWYVLDVEPGARLIHGVASALSRVTAERAIADGALGEMLHYVSVAPGDVILNPPGTIHAVGWGILLYELQQSSDLTYRLFDWDRNDPARPLHIQKALDVADLEPLVLHQVRPVALKGEGATRTFLCACQHFAAEMLTVEGRIREQPGGVCFHTLTVLQGRGGLRFGRHPVQAVSLSPGESILVPAGVQEYEIVAQDGRLAAIKAYVPDLVPDVVMPLRAAGIPDHTIIQLGGDPRRSDLARVL